MDHNNTSQNHNSFDKTQSQYARKMEREKQISKMEQIATGVLANDDHAVIIEDASNDDELTSMTNNPPRAFENARRFLWDEDEDEDDIMLAEDPHYKKNRSHDSKNKSSPKTKRPSVFPINLAPRFQLDRGDASPPYEEDGGGFLPTDVRSFGGSDFHSAYRKSFVQNRTTRNQRHKGRTSHVGGILSKWFHGACCGCRRGCPLVGCEGCVACWARLNRAQKILLVLLGCACLGLSIFGIVALARQPGSGGGGDSGSSTSTTVDVREALDPERYEDIRTVILDAGVSDPHRVDEPGSAQNKALLWLTDHDAAAYDAEDERLVERYAFATFFFATHPNQDAALPAPQWTKSYKWMTAADICEWHGIKCHSSGDAGNPERQADQNMEEDRVVHLNLTDNHVQGPIPSELAAAEHLKLLDLAFNEITGSIPSSLGSLEHLMDLVLNDNKLSGTIPTELAMCTHMKNFTIDRNDNIEGTIPTEFSELSNLRHFGVHKNKLGGPLLDTAKMPHLELLELGENEFTGTIHSEFGALSKLVELRLRENQLKGTVPSEIGRLSHLVVFHHSHNEITGTIPPEIMAGCTMLEDYRFQHNSMSGPLPSEVGWLTNLGNLNLEDNQFTGTLPTTLENLKALHKFRFFRNDFSGTVPAGLCDGRWWNELAGDCGDIGKIECDCCTHCGGN